MKIKNTHQAAVAKVLSGKAGFSEDGGVVSTSIGIEILNAAIDCDSLEAELAEKAATVVEKAARAGNAACEAWGDSAAYFDAVASHAADAARISAKLTLKREFLLSLVRAVEGSAATRAVRDAVRAAAKGQ